MVSQKPHDYSVHVTTEKKGREIYLEAPENIDGLLEFQVRWQADHRSLSTLCKMRSRTQNGTYNIYHQSTACYDYNNKTTETYLEQSPLWLFQHPLRPAIH